MESITEASSLIFDQSRLYISFKKKIRHGLNNFLLIFIISLAPEMCQKFVQSCQATEGPTYRGTIIYQVGFKLPSARTNFTQN